MTRQVACFHPLDGAMTVAPDRLDPWPLTAKAPILEALDLSISFGRARGLNRLFARKAPAPVVQAVSFQLGRGEVLGLVGESGSGKSTILRAIAGILAPSGGAIALASETAALSPLAASMTARPLGQLRRVQMVFQNPETSLNPRHTIFEILAQPLRLYGTAGAGGLRARAAALLADVRLNQDYLDRYPAQLSGGERQRVAIARAFAADPEVLLCDEITTALDVSVQAAVLKLVRDLARERDVATIFVSHDLAVVRAISDRIAVLQAGRIVEIGLADDLCRRPGHAYTQKLLGAVLEASPAGA